MKVFPFAKALINSFFLNKSTENLNVISYIIFRVKRTSFTVWKSYMIKLGRLIVKGKQNNVTSKQKNHFTFREAFRFTTEKAFNFFHTSD